MKESRWTVRPRLKRPETISLLHPTVRPDNWYECCQNWYRNCDCPEYVEYVLVPERSRFPENFKPDIPFNHHIVQWNTHAASIVGGLNCAAEVSSGKVFVNLSDRYFSAPHWDTDLRHVLANKMDTEVVVWASQNQVYVDNANVVPTHMVHAIMTKSYYQKWGYVLNPEYTDWYVDNELHEVSERDGVLLDARGTLFFKKVIHMDEFEQQYARDASKSKAIYDRRKAAGFPRGA